MPLNSMTGFAAVEDRIEGGWRWRWEVRSVNARGLDARLRLPGGFESLDPALRRMVQARFKRGTVTATGTLRRDEGAAEGLEIQPEGLAAALRALGTIRAAMSATDLPMQPVSAEALLTVRGVLADGRLEQPETAERDGIALALSTGFEAAVGLLATARAEEGARLETVLRDKITTIAALTDAAQDAAQEAHTAMADRLRMQVASLMEAGAPLDEPRLAQELAHLAVKNDTSEEIDRLRGHVEAARDLLDTGGTIGRRLDFLTQEFNREANTLCAKSTSADLTRIGLDLKVAVDQVREQAQNVE